MGEEHIGWQAVLWRLWEKKILRENKIPPFRGGMVVFWDRFGGKRLYNLDKTFRK